MIIHSEYINFSQISDPIRTEEFIYNQIIKQNINFNYVSLPIAYSINKFGVEKTQFFVDEINKKCTEKKVFVCQHILVNKINFGDNYVFTPHTTNSDNFFFIPHYNPVYDCRKEFTKISDRSIDFSFMGDYSTNQLRTDISKIQLNNYICQPTGKWFFSHDQNTQKSLKEKYIQIIENTKFPFCPPGTGPSTLRLFEVLASGGIPIIFNDLKIPDNLNKLIIRLSLDDLTNGNVYNLLNNDFNDMQSEILDIYWGEYSNDNLYQSIIKKFI